MHKRGEVTHFISTHITEASFRAWPEILLIITYCTLSTLCSLSLALWECMCCRTVCTWYWKTRVYHLLLWKLTELSGNFLHSRFTSERSLFLTAGLSIQLLSGLTIHIKVWQIKGKTVFCHAVGGIPFYWHGLGPRVPLELRVSANQCQVLLPLSYLYTMMIHFSLDECGLFQDGSTTIYRAWGLPAWASEDYNDVNHTLLPLQKTYGRLGSLWCPNFAFFPF